MGTTVIILRIAEALACLTGFYYWKKWKGTALRYFTFYLLWIVAVEFFGAYTLKHNLIKENIFFFNYIATPVEFFFFFFFFWKTDTSPGKKIIYLICIATFIIAWLADQLVLQHKRFFFSSLASNVGTIGLLIVLLKYFFGLIKGDTILKFYFDPLFWISCGAFVYYLGTFPFYGIYNTLLYQYRSIFNVYQVAAILLSAMMYLFFTSAFIWGKPKL